MTPIRVGLVGTGNIAEHAYQAFAQLPNVAVTCVCSRPSPRRDEFCREFPTHMALDRLEDLLDLAPSAPGFVDAVFIATPNFLHAAQAELALRAGKHVLLDKPMATHLSEAKRIQAALEASSGVAFLLGMDHRLLPDAMLLKKTRAQGSLGDIREVRAVWQRRAGIPQKGSWFGHRAFSGGGVLLDLGVHLLDLAFYTLGDFDVQTVSGSVRSVYGHRGLGHGSWGKSSPANLPFDVEDTASAKIVMRSGTTIHLELAWAAPIERNEVRLLELVGDRGTASLASCHHSEILASNRYEHFIEMVRTSLPPLVTLEQALVVQNVLDAIYESSSTGREVLIAP